MTERLSHEEWREVLALSEVIGELPASERLVYLQSATASPHVIREVLALLDDQEPESRGGNARVGESIGRFLITAYVGAGGMGEVYAAIDTELERTVALKFLNQEVLGAHGAAERFVREARTASALNHPNIVTIHEVIRAGSTVAIVMEFVEGTTLRELCAAAPLPPLRVAEIGAQIALALGAAHRAGVVHCDVKPENVIVRRDGTLKVLDFGLAHRVAQGGSPTSYSGVIGGTWRYMAPEQIQGHPVSGATDVFSLGLVLYELCTGRHAFAMESPIDAVPAIVAREPRAASELNTALPSALDNLIRGMLIKDAAGRPSADAVADSLAELRKPDLPAARDIHALRSALKWVALGLAAALAIVGWFVRHRFWPERLPTFYQVTTLVSENRATAAAISPDGRMAAYANVDGIFLRSLQGGSTDRVAVPPSFLVYKIEWFTDGKKLLVSGFDPETNISSIWTIPVSGGQPTLVREGAGDAVPSPRGDRIAFSTADQSSIWVLPLNGEQPREVVAGPVGDSFPAVFWLPNGRSLGFQRRHYSHKQDLGLVMLDRFFERSYEAVDVETKRITARTPNIWVESGAPLRNGWILFLRWEAPGENRANELWEVETDPRTGAFRGAPRKVASPIVATDDTIYGMTATPDGQRAMMLRRSDEKSVFVADFDARAERLSNIRRLTLDARPAYPHAWTPDNGAVIFESDRNGDWDIFEQRLDGRLAEMLVGTPKRWEVLPQMSPNGRWVLFAQGTIGGQPGPYRLMRVPLYGGPMEEVPIGGALDEYRCSLSASGRCVLRMTVGRQFYVFYDLNSMTGKGRELARTAWLPSTLWDWDVSPDGSQAAIPNHDVKSARVRLVALGSKRPAEREVELAGLRSLSGLTWAANGSGWFIPVPTPLGNRLIFASTDGHWHALGDIHGWGVPSPDGHRLAFVNPISATNAWVIDRTGNAGRPATQ